MAADSFYFKTTQPYVNLLNGNFIPTNIFMITYDEVYHMDRSKNSIASSNFLTHVKKMKFLKTQKIPLKANILAQRQFLKILKNIFSN